MASDAAAAAARLSLLLVASLQVCLLTCPAGASLVGGKRERLPSDPEVQEAAAFAVDAYNLASNDVRYFKVAGVLKAESQVVAGIKYFLTVEIVNTSCEKRGNPGLKQVDLAHCSVPSDAEQKKLICTFVVWSRAWINDTKLLSMSCTPATEHGASK